MTNQARKLTLEQNGTFRSFYEKGLADFATKGSASRGRLHEKLDHDLRSPFQHDRDRVIHSTAFRRLKHKTQVFIAPQGDHFRTRLTHTLEMTQIARTLARALRVDEDLTETIALAHDLGHPPFGHEGEDTLNDCMKDYGGFNHNDQVLRILNELESSYCHHAGLNLTFESLEGIAKHNGPVTSDKLGKLPYLQGLNERIQRAGHAGGLRLEKQPTLEAQLAAASDDVAYEHHDLEDALRAGLIQMSDLIKEHVWIGERWDRLKSNGGDAEESVLQRSLIRGQIGEVVEDLLAITLENLGRLSPTSPEDIACASDTVVRSSALLQKRRKGLRNYVREKVYLARNILEERRHGRGVVRSLFERYLKHPKELPGEWQKRVEREEREASRARVIANYVAGMTDQYSRRELARQAG